MGALGDRANLPRDVFERVVDDFDSIKAELVDVHGKIASGSKFKKWFSSPDFVESLSTTLDRLRPLELHLDFYGLMSYRENTIAYCFGDLSSSIQKVSGEVALELQPILNELMFKVDAMYERLDMGTNETMTTGRSGTAAGTSVRTFDEMEALSLAEFSSLSSKARELLEMLASSGISSDGKQELCEKN